VTNNTQDQPFGSSTSRAVLSTPESPWADYLLVGVTTAIAVVFSARLGLNLAGSCMADSVTADLIGLGISLCFVIWRCSVDPMHRIVVEGEHVVITRVWRREVIALRDAVSIVWDRRPDMDEAALARLLISPQGQLPLREISFTPGDASLVAAFERFLDEQQAKRRGGEASQSFGSSKTAR
jgi:hypothetical protein